MVLILAGLIPLTTHPLVAQTSTLKGFVSDQSNGQALEGATIALFALETTRQPPLHGTATTAEGVYIINKIEPGNYRLRISFIGFIAHEEMISLSSGESKTLSVALLEDAEAMSEVVIESQRAVGIPDLLVGKQEIRPEDIEAIPSPDISADLATYLTVLPGVVTTGDRGGQFFVRGGEPPQNLVLLDDIVIYQPFHVLGFYSAFPADIIEKVDFYASGYGAKYAGRLSSVIDVQTRAGNLKRFGGHASLSPFTSTISLEGPIVPDKVSFLVSGRTSNVKQSGEHIYKEDLPFDFDDGFAKIQFSPGQRHRFAVAGLRTYDRGRLVPDLEAEASQDIIWRNKGFSFSWLSISRSLPLATKLTFSSSEHKMEQGASDGAQRFSKIATSRVGLEAIFSDGSFFGGSAHTRAGW